MLLNNTVPVFSSNPVETVDFIHLSIHIEKIFDREITGCEVHQWGSKQSDLDLLPSSSRNHHHLVCWKTSSLIQTVEFASLRFCEELSNQDRWEGRDVRHYISPTYADDKVHGWFERMNMQGNNLLKTKYFETETSVSFESIIWYEPI